MKKIAIALLLAVVLMFLFAAPVLAAEPGALGKLRHAQAPGQDGLPPGYLGGVIAGYATSGPQVLSEVILPWTPAR